DKQVRLWNLATGAKERDFPSHTLPITSVAFGPGGTTVAAGSADKSITVWNTADAKVIKKVALPAIVNSVAVSPDGKFVAAGLADNSLRIIDVAQGKEIKNLAGSKGAINTVAYTPKGDQLISGSADATVQVWNVADGMAKGKLDAGGAVTT